jgi:hypothetical protein
MHGPFVADSRLIVYLIVWHLKLHKIIRRIEKMDKKIVCAMFITVAVFCMADGSDAAGKARIPKTGETTNRFGAGSDGALHKGVAWPNPRFTDNNGNGTVTDNLTGLIWLKNAGCFDTVGGIAKGSAEATSNIVWAAALTWSNNLANGSCSLSDGSVAGDWRLPSVTELSSLALPTGHPFTSVQGSYYWSSTTYANLVSSAWAVSMDGSIGGDVKGVGYYVWPVRGGQ